MLRQINTRLMMSGYKCKNGKNHGAGQGYLA